LGNIDILVNNAGIQHVAPIENFADDKWDDIIAINLTGAFHAIKTAIPIMKKNGFGRIINIASAHGLVGSANKSAYVAAKHGIVGLTKVVALEVAELNITCNAICPGWVKTPLVEKQIAANAASEDLSIEAATKNLLFEKQPSLKFVSVEEIGEVVKFLSSDMAKSITGIALPIDGGWTAR
jgi:3-hydroxybutyrate dehydrogenase